MDTPFDSEAALAYCEHGRYSIPTHQLDDRQEALPHHIPIVLPRDFLSSLQSSQGRIQGVLGAPALLPCVPWSRAPPTIFNHERMRGRRKGGGRREKKEIREEEERKMSPLTLHPRFATDVWFCNNLYLVLLVGV